VLRALSNQFGRHSYLEEGTDFTDLQCPIVLEEFREGIISMYEDLNRKDKLKELGGQLGQGNPAPVPSKATEFRSRILALG
jgi:hypothetical protein